MCPVAVPSTTLCIWIPHAENTFNPDVGIIIVCRTAQSSSTHTIDSALCGSGQSWIAKTSDSMGLLTQRLRKDLTKRCDSYYPPHFTHKPGQARATDTLLGGEPRLVTQFNLLLSRAANRLYSPERKKVRP